MIPRARSMIAATYVSDIDASRAFYRLLGFCEHSSGKAEASAWSVMQHEGVSVLLASTGPMGTRNYQIALEAVPLPAGRTFIHLSYSYEPGLAGRLALKGYLAGPYEHRPALDEVVQFQTGLAFMTGPLGQPLRAGASVIDKWARCSALLPHRRRCTSATLPARGSASPVRSSRMPRS